MNYIKPEQIKAYVEQNPEGIAGMSEDLATMVNHFAQLVVAECCLKLETDGMVEVAMEMKEHFGVEE